MTYPKCGCDQWKLASLIHAEGTSTKSGLVFGSGWSLSAEHWQLSCDCEELVLTDFFQLKQQQYYYLQSVCPTLRLGFIPPYSKRIFEFASSGLYPRLKQCEIHVVGLAALAACYSMCYCILCAYFLKKLFAFKVYLWVYLLKFTKEKTLSNQLLRVVNWRKR